MSKVKMHTVEILAVECRERRCYYCADLLGISKVWVDDAAEPCFVCDYCAENIPPNPFYNLVLCPMCTTRPEHLKYHDGDCPNARFYSVKNARSVQ